MAYGKVNNVIYVSTNGNDSWSGKYSTPNASHSDGPLLTLQGAIDIVRNLKLKASSQNGYTIELREGTYVLDKTIRLFIGDSGTKTSPFIISSYPGEKVVISGSKEIKNFEKVTDADILGKLDSEVSAHIMQAQITLYPYKTLELNNRDQRFFELFYKNSPLDIARFPKKSFLNIQDVSLTPRDTLIFFKESQPEKWSNGTNLYAHGYWARDWDEDFLEVKNINYKDHSVSFESPQAKYGYEKGQRFYFLNIISAISSPGEYAFNGSSKTVYLYPKEGNKDTSPTYPFVPNLVNLKEISWIEFKNITFEESFSAAIIVNASGHVTFDNCIFRNISSSAIIAKQVSYFELTNSELYNLASGAIELEGGDRKTLTSGNNFIHNNTFYNFSRLIRTHTPAIRIEGVGTTISNNLIYNAPQSAIMVSGNDHIIEFNEIHDVGFETGMGGAIYFWGDQTYLGNVIRYNYFHNITGALSFPFRAIHIDGFVGGVHIIDNIFESCKHGILVEGGSFNTIENNIFTGCERSVTVEKVDFSPGDQLIAFLKANFKNMSANKTLLENKYPVLAEIATNTKYLPIKNTFIHNISIGGHWLHTNMKDNSLVTDKENFISEDKAIIRAKDFEIDRKRLPVFLQSSFPTIPFYKIGLQNQNP